MFLIQLTRLIHNRVCNITKLFLLLPLLTFVQPTHVVAGKVKVGLESSILVTNGHKVYYPVTTEDLIHAIVPTITTTSSTSDIISRLQNVGADQNLNNLDDPFTAGASLYNSLESSNAASDKHKKILKPILNEQKLKLKHPNRKQQIQRQLTNEKDPSWITTTSTSTNTTSSTATNDTDKDTADANTVDTDTNKDTTPGTFPAKSPTTIIQTAATDNTVDQSSNGDTGPTTALVVVPTPASSPTGTDPDTSITTKHPVSAPNPKQNQIPSPAPRVRSNPQPVSEPTNNDKNRNNNNDRNNPRNNNNNRRTPRPTRPKERIRNRPTSRNRNRNNNNRNQPQNQQPTDRNSPDRDQDDKPTHRPRSKPTTQPPRTTPTSKPISPVADQSSTPKPVARPTTTSLLTSMRPSDLSTFSSSDLPSDIPTTHMFNYHTSYEPTQTNSESDNVGYNDPNWLQSYTKIFSIAEVTYEFEISSMNVTNITNGTADGQHRQEYQVGQIMSETDITIFEVTTEAWYQQYYEAVQREEDLQNKLLRLVKPGDEPTQSNPNLRTSNALGVKTPHLHTGVRDMNVRIEVVEQTFLSSNHMSIKCNQYLSYSEYLHTDTKNDELNQDQDFSSLAIDVLSDTETSASTTKATKHGDSSLEEYNENSVQQFPSDFYVVLPFQDVQTNSQYGNRLRNELPLIFGSITIPIPIPVVNTINTTTTGTLHSQTYDPGWESSSKSPSQHQGDDDIGNIDKNDKSNDHKQVDNFKNLLSVLALFGIVFSGLVIMIVCGFIVYKVYFNDKVSVQRFRHRTDLVEGTDVFNKALSSIHVHDDDITFSSPTTQRNKNTRLKSKKSFSTNNDDDIRSISDSDGFQLKSSYEGNSVASYEFDYARIGRNRMDDGTLMSGVSSDLDHQQRSENSQHSHQWTNHLTHDEITIMAPPGKLGFVLDKPDSGPAIIHDIQTDSPLFGQIKVDDRVMAIDGIDVRFMTTIQISNFISGASSKPVRTITLLRRKQDRDLVSNIGTMSNLDDTDLEYDSDDLNSMEDIAKFR